MVIRTKYVATTICGSRRGGTGNAYPNFANFTHLIVMLWLCATLLCGCEQKPAGQPLIYSKTPAAANQTKSYRLVPHPLYNPRRMNEAMQPLADYLEERLLGTVIELEPSRDYQAFEAKFRKRAGEILMPNPWQTLEAMKQGYRVIAMWGEAEDFKGLIIVRKDSGIRKPADLVGKVVSYPSPTALAAAIMPQYYLHSHGVDISRELDNHYVGSQESSIMNVYLGQSVAGGTWPPPWRLFQKDHPEEAAQLKVIWQTESMINNSVMVRDDMPEEDVHRIQTALLDLTETPQGLALLRAMETSAFYSADNASYDIVRSFISRFENEVRKVESR